MVAAIALMFASCSKEETAAPMNDTEKASLSFGTLLNGMVNNKAALKQQMEMPDCSDGTPMFVEVVLTGPEDVGTMDEPLVVAINATPGDFDGDS